MRALLEYAHDERVEVPKDVLGSALKDDWEAQSSAFNRLTELIAPARPQTVVLLQQEKGKRERAKQKQGVRRAQGAWYALGPVPLIRFLVLTALLFLVAFVTLLGFEAQGSSSGGEGSDEIDWSTAAALVAAAGLGATFEALFRATQAIEAKTYDPLLDGTYVLRVVQGVVAGVLLVLVLPTDQTLNLTPYGLAIVGGFGAAAVYRILARFVEAVEGLVTPPPADVAESARREAELRVQREHAELLPILASALPMTTSPALTGVLHDLWKRLAGTEPPSAVRPPSG